MKIKVDKKEYKHLLERVDYLEEEIKHTCEDMFKNWRWTRESLYEMMEDYFKSQCIYTMVKRDKDLVIGEVHKNIMNNLFKEEK